MLKFSTVIAAAGAAAALIAAAPAPQSAWAFNLKTIDGKPMPLAQYKGKVVLLVNTASFCGFTPQYEGLQKLYDTYKGQGLTVIGVPSGDFGGQEYEKAAETKTFCESKFGIKFPLTEKSVVSGPNAAPIYRWASATFGANRTPQWNFHKYLIGKDGKIIAAFPSKITPMSAEVTTAVQQALKG